MSRILELELLKKCSTCSQLKPLTVEYFYTRKDSKDGFRGVCRTCDNQIKNKYWGTDKGKITAKKYRSTELGKQSEKRSGKGIVQLSEACCGTLMPA